jgi:spore coat polysaccharide biosynthesis predicted glycosyltransferase SpsG
VGHALTGCVTLAYDDGPGAGLGHRRRIETLATELEARGWWCPTVALRDRGRVVGDLVVVDSYRVRADDPSRISARRVVALDDLARDLDVDIVVDPSPGADAGVHVRAARVLAGAPYALASVPAVEAVPVGGPVDRVVVTTGASDTAGVGARLAASIATSLPAAEVRLVLGPWGAPDVPPGVVPVRAPHGLAEELAAAPVVVTAGGVAMLESCLLGRATVAVVLAHNQRQAVAGLAHTGAVVTGTLSTTGNVVATLVSSSARREELAAAARRALDGRGPARLADVIEELAA